MNNNHRHPLSLMLGSALLLAALSSPLTALADTRTSAFDYDTGTGLLTKEIIEPDTPDLCLVTEYTYDGYGNKTAATTRNCNGSTGSVTGSTGNSEATAPTGDARILSPDNSGTLVSAPRTSSSVYDSRGQFAVTARNALWDSSNNPNQKEDRVYDARFGTVTQLTGPNGLITYWAYDSFGRKTLEQRADGNGTQWEYKYCTSISGGTETCPTINGAVGKTVVITTPRASVNASAGTYGSANGVVSKTYYDSLNREIRSESQGFDGSGSSSAIYKDTQYNSLGQVYQVSRPYNSGQTVYWITYTYDSLGRVLSETQADGATTSTAYNGLTVTITNANSQTRTTLKNSQGQVISVTDAYGKVLTMQYDAFGNLARTIDSLGNANTLSYDTRGRKTGMVDRDMGNWTYVYDALGQLVKQTDAKTQTSTIAYDKLGRMVKRTEPDLISKWYYDRYKGEYAPTSSCTKGIGKLCQSETSTGYNQTITYDSLGRYSSGSTTIDVPTPYVDAVTYDSNGRVSTRTYPSGLITYNEYTTLGYLKVIHQTDISGAAYWTANSMDAEGHLLTQTFGNSVATQQSYNAANGRITGIVAGAGNAVQNFVYTYDSLGNILTRQDNNEVLTESFTYDSLNRLTNSTVNAPTGIISKTYAYNEIGNITSRSDLGNYTYPSSGTSSARPHAVSSVAINTGTYNGQSLNFVYDANGSLVSQTQLNGSTVVTAQSRIEFYTSFNMPNALAQGTYSSSFYYGPDHQRVIQLSSSQGATIYVNPGNDPFYERDIHGDGSIEQRNFISAYGMAVAIVKTTIATTTVTTTRYLHRDNLGSTTTITDESGTVIERLAYEPYGKRRFPTGADDSGNTIRPLNTDRGFTNHEHIDEIGIIHMNGRIYDPLVGRFVSADPYIQDPYNMQSYNRYMYCFGNPVICTDPSGYFNLGHAISHAWKSFRSSTLGQVVLSQLGFVGGVLQTGTLQGGLRAAFNTVLAIAGGAAGDNYWLQAGIGCVSGSASGGGCGRGAVSAVAATWANGATQGWSDPARFMASVVAGGTVSVIGGGKFANGAVTGAFAYVVENAVHALADSGNGPEDGPVGGTSAAGSTLVEPGELSKAQQTILADQSWANPTNGDVRNCDPRGCGAFGASRVGGQHGGLDLDSVPGQSVVAPTSGTFGGRIIVPKSGEPGIRINLANGIHVDVLYVTKIDSLKIGDPIETGQNIGTARNIRQNPAYGSQITNHVHVQIKVGNLAVDPSGYIPSRQ